MKVRLNKYLSECGLASRRKADQLILDGRITVNGNSVFELGVKVDPENDKIQIDGDLLKQKNKIYFLLYKPKGVITSTKDERKRRTVVDLIKTNEKIYPVGRLDYNTTGLLLLTNDGQLTNYLTHPKYKIERVYEAILDKPLQKEDKDKYLSGIFLEGRKSYFSNIYFPKENNFKIIRVTTVEGRNHFVKKMFAKFGYNVNELKRIKYGNLTLKNMKPGEYRKLTSNEVTNLLKKK